jgi:hypothetical protein
LLAPHLLLNHIYKGAGELLESSLTQSLEIEASEWSRIIIASGIGGGNGRAETMLHLELTHRIVQ